MQWRVWTGGPWCEDALNPLEPTNQYTVMSFQVYCGGAFDLELPGDSCGPAPVEPTLNWMMEIIRSVNPDIFGGKPIIRGRRLGR